MMLLLRSLLLRSLLLRSLLLSLLLLPVLALPVAAMAQGWLAPPAGQQPELLEASDVFKVEATAGDDGATRLSGTIAPGYYLYRHRLSVVADSGAAMPLKLSNGKSKTDEFFGLTEVYYDAVEIEVDGRGARSATLHWQGCADAGICYPPQTMRVDLPIAKPAPAPAKAAASLAATAPPADRATRDNAPRTPVALSAPVVAAGHVAGLEPAATAPAPAPSPVGEDQHQSIPGPSAAPPERRVPMVSLGPFPMSLLVLLVALAIAALVARPFVKSAPGQPTVKPFSTILDMLMVGVVVARLGFVLAWLPQYLADPWSIIRIGDGGFLVWAGVLAGLAFGAWQARNIPALRRPLLFGAAAGLASWAALGGALLLMQQSAVKLPATELSTLDGGRAKLSAMTGKPMVVNLWATWCPPCRREMPVLAKAQSQRGDVTFAFVNQGESESQIRDYLRGSQLHLVNVLVDPFSSVSQESGSRGLPTTLFFDADGRLVDTHMGELTNAGLAVKLQRFGPAPLAIPQPIPSKEVP